MGGEEIQGAVSERCREPGGESEPVGGGGVHVRGCGGQPLAGFLRPLPVDCPERRMVDEVGIDTDLGRSQFGLWEVAAADAQICGDISDDVDELQGLTETARLESAFGRGGPVCVSEVDDVGPELADATGHEVGVFLEFEGVFQEEQALRVREARPVEDLTGDDLFEDFDHVVALVVWEALEKVEGEGRELQKGAFSGVICSG